MLLFRNSYDESAEQGPADYVDGPSITGSGLQAAVDKGISFVKTEWCKCKTRPIDLVGHSRGGHGVIMLATTLRSGIKCKGESSLSFPRIRFMGLYDAVAMYIPTGGAMDIPSNVENSSHAVRDPATTSRASWGNSGMNRPVQAFMGNHSAIGGDPEHGDRITYIGNGNSKRGLRAGFYNNIAPYTRPGGQYGFDETIYPNQTEVNAYNNGMALNRIASRESDAYIRSGATRAGVKLK